MSTPTRICAITSSRADYGLLRWPMMAIAKHEALELKLIATGTHLSHKFGYTKNEILDDDFAIDQQVEILDNDAVGSEIATADSMARALSGVSRAMSQIAPDIVLILGDRYEILACACAALIQRIPIAHIAGGDITEGAYDDAIRHSISKMSHIHFPTNEASAELLRQLGEDPIHIHSVGNPGLDAIAHLKPPDRERLFAKLGARDGSPNLIVTYHPVTLGDAGATDDINALLAALADIPKDATILFTGTNTDTGYEPIRNRIHRFVESNPNATYRESLGHELYFDVLREFDAVVGNSSSGILEAPSFEIPTVNIGPRQDGRLRATSVFDVNPDKEAIVAAIKNALKTDCSNVVNPYGDGKAGEKIAQILGEIQTPAALLRKKFSVYPPTATETLSR